MKLFNYNEKNYLFDPKAIRKIEELGLYSQDKADLEKRLYKDALEHYDEFIEEVAKLIHHLGFSSTIECSIMISFLIHNGFLSNDCFIIDRSPDAKKEISHRLGTSIIKGEGCCRNYTNMLKDIFEVLDLPTDNFYCYQGSMKRALEKPANHVISLMPYEGNIYGIDTYNRNTLFRFRNGLYTIEVSRRPKRELLYKPYYEIVLGENDYNGVKARIKRFDNYSKQDTINRTQYIHEIKQPTEKRMERKFNELYSFHEKTKSLKKQICREIRSHQK